MMGEPERGWDMSEWRDIASAPKGSAYPVIIAVPRDGGYGIGEAYYRSQDDSDDGWWWAGTSPGDYYAEAIFPEPTHWMPLPEPPSPSVE
jgi:hypothetical protein